MLLFWRNLFNFRFVIANSSSGYYFWIMSWLILKLFLNLKQSYCSKYIFSHVNLIFNVVPEVVSIFSGVIPLDLTSRAGIKKKVTLQDKQTEERQLGRRAERQLTSWHFVKLKNISDNAVFQEEREWLAGASQRGKTANSLLRRRTDFHRSSLVHMERASVSWLNIQRSCLMQKTLISRL